MQMPYYISQPPHPQCLEFVSHLKIILEKQFGISLEESSPVQVDEFQEKLPKQQSFADEGAQKTKLLRFIVS